MRTFECTDRKISQLSPEGFRCWKCPGCAFLRSWLKGLRIQLEALGHDDRVWLATLTFAKVPEDEVQAYKLVQEYLKRVRFRLAKKDGSRLRYTCVVEFGKLRNRMHYHMVIYSGSSLTWRILDDWPNGHAHYKLVSGAQAVKYVLKYLAKGHGKVRSSAQLGVECVKKVTEHPQVQAIASAFPGAKIVRIGHTRVPRELGKPMLRTRGEVLKDWRSMSDSEIISSDGMSNHDWQKWAKWYRKSRVYKPDYSEFLEGNDDDSQRRSEEPEP